MEKTKKTVIYSQYEDDILICEKYSDGSIKGEFTIINTPYGFQLRAFHDSWKIFKDCSDLMEFLSENSMSGVTMKMLAEEIGKIGYELMII